MKHLTKTDRQEIKILLEKGYKHREIGCVLNISHTTVSREIKRNSCSGKYLPHRANTKARVRRKHSKYQGMRIENNKILRSYIIDKLEHKSWTPEEIAGRIKHHDTHLSYVSSKAIYKWLYSVHGQLYCRYLPSKQHRPKKRRKKKTKRTMVPNRIGIEERPSEANNREEFGHFEEDTMVSGRKTKSKAALAVFCDRASRLAKLGKMKDMKPSTHVKVQQKMAEGLSIKTCTKDNGIENKFHELLAKLLSIKIFFCNPYSPWEKGTVENTIGRIRRFIPKGADVSKYSNKEIQKIEDWLNHTPRKCLNYRTPYEMMLLLTNSSS